MSDLMKQTIGATDARKQEQSIDLRPTLFIGIGGTGMEVLMRVRRRILNNFWGTAGARTRVDSLVDFPVAQFIQFDLDSGAVIEAGRAQPEDLQFEQVKFTDEEKIVESFDIDKYSRDDDALDKYPHIKEWLSLTPKKIRELGIDPAKGAGQVRAVSRLYLFDKYTKLRDKIRLKLMNLKAGLTHAQQLSKLGLRMESDKFRIVVVCSVAGGTGSGAFLDMGLLARWLAKAAVGNADVELLLFLPTGYSGANKERTEANGYAALMELESAMLGNKGYVGRWDAYTQPELPREPFNEVYLIDTGNLAQQHTKEVKDVYHMVADTLFEDFASGDFARRKRSVAVNQAQHKNFLHDALVPKSRFPDMRLSYSRRFSAFGQAVLDTRQEERREERAHRWAADMLKAFFGVGGGDAGSHRATDKHRDDFMATHMALRPAPFSDFPEFSDKGIVLKRSNGEFLDYSIVDELLQDRHGLLLAGVEQRVNIRIDEIRSGFARAEWPTQVREAVKQLERDAMRDQDSTADTTEDRVTKQRAKVLERVKKNVREQFYAYLDNKDYGGLEYVLSMVEQIKDRLEAPGSGLLAVLGANAERYREIKEAVRSRECERLLDNLAQTKGGFFGGGEKQAATVMDHLRTEIANALKFHLRAKAADEAVALMVELSAWLGRKTGIDAQGRPVWDGLMAEFQEGREAVLAMLAQLQHANTVLRQEIRQDHATLIAVQVEERDAPPPGAGQMREWADEAFKDVGGSKALFPMLADPEQRAGLLVKVKRMAARQIRLAGVSDQELEEADPLLAALEQMTPVERVGCFRKLLACAMPWIDANMMGDFSVRSDQYKCFLGVAGAENFKRRFGAELEACVPTLGGITGAQLAIVETGAPGRAVCYCELSGVPLTVLRGLEAWRASYRKEAERNPTHTHIDSTQFSHPLAPSTEEINRLADDFRLFLLAVMMGVLSRSTLRVVPPGQYQFAVARGDVRRIGNERAVRQNGLPVAYRDSIAERVQERLAELDEAQTVAMAALCAYHANAVYTPVLVADETGAEQVRQGFASAIAAECEKEMLGKVVRKGMAEAAARRCAARLVDQIEDWAGAIPDSDADAYPWEVRGPGDDGKPRLKFQIKAEMMAPGRLDALLKAGEVAQAQLSAQAHQSAQAAQAPMGMPAAAAFPPSPGGVALPPPLGGMPPPLVAHQYHVGINGQQYGPYNAQMIGQMVQSGQIDPASAKVWRQGLADWTGLNQLAELAALLQPAAQGMPPPLAPPPLA